MGLGLDYWQMMGLLLLAICVMTTDWWKRFASCEKDDKE